MSRGQNSTIIALMTLLIGGSVVLAEPLLKNNKPSSLNSKELLTQNSEPQIRMGQRGKFGHGRILQELNLSGEQTQQLEEIKQQYEGQMEPLQEKIKTLHQDLRTMMTGTASVNEIRAKHQELVNLREQMGNVRFESMLAMREILTPEQRNKFAQIMEQRRGNFRQQSDDPSESNE